MVVRLDQVKTRALGWFGLGPKFWGWVRLGFKKTYPRQTLCHPAQNKWLVVVQVPQEPRRLANVGDARPISFPRQNGDHEFLEIVRTVAAHRELGSLNDEPQQSLVVVVVERQATHHLR